VTRHRVIVKRLSAVQDLGAINVLCTDKTGTLTEGRIRLERRRVSVLVERDRQRMLVVKGSPEDVLRLCANYESRDGRASFPLDGAALLLPFLPMLPIQILVNNFRYDLSEIAIPFDNVDEEVLARPHPWDMDFVRRVMLAFGPISSLFDFLTFFLLLQFFHAGEDLFHTGWFVESIATQVLVIFVIRTQGNPLTNRPNLGLTLLSLAVVAVGAALPFSPAGEYLGLVRPPVEFYLALVGIVAAYLAVVEVAKRAFYRSWRERVAVRARHG